MAVKEYCTVDINTRVISIPENQRTIGVEHDKNVYRLYFKIARKPTEDFDLMNSVIYINYRNANKDVGQFMVSDLKQDGEFVNFSWLINSGTLSYKGNIDFIICARQATGDELYKEWNTTLAHCVCLEGIEPKENEGIEEAEKDIITQLIQYANNLHNQSTILNADSEKLHNQAEELSKIAIDASEKANDALDRALTPVTDVDFYKGRILSGMTYSGKASNKGVKLHRVEGNSIQRTTTGKNILPNFAKSKVMGGVTYTVNEDKSITIKGTATSTSYIHLIGHIDNDYTTEKFKIDTDYAITHTGHSNISILGKMTNGTYRALYKNNNQVDIKGVSFGALYIEITKGTTVDTTVYPQIEYGTTITDYEPYTGGKSSPNAEYQQKIKSVEIKNIRSTNKNLFNPNNFLNTLTNGAINGLKFTLDIQNKLIVNGTATDIVDVLLNESYLPNKAKGKYTLSNNKGLENYVKSSELGYIKNSINITDTNKLINAFVRIPKGKTFNNDYLDIMFEKSDIKSQYIPYKGDEVQTDIILRSLPNGDIDVYENEVINRKIEYIEINIDKANNIAYNTQSTNNIQFVIHDLSKDKLGVGTENMDTGNIVSNVGVSKQNHPTKTGIWLYEGLSFVMVIAKSLLDTEDVAGFKKWLSQNPIEVQYKLATPVLEKVNVPTIPSYYPYTNVWTDNTIETEMTYELLANSDDSLKVEELEKRILALETKMIGG